MYKTSKRFQYLLMTAHNTTTYRDQSFYLLFIISQVQAYILAVAALL